MAKFLVSIDNAEDLGERLPPAVRNEIAALQSPTFLASTLITRNPDGTIASVTENGVTTTYAYNTDQTVHTDTRLGVTRQYTYDADGNLTEIEVI